MSSEFAAPHKTEARGHTSVTPTVGIAKMGGFHGKFQVQWETVFKKVKDVRRQQTLTFGLRAGEHTNPQHNS